MAPTSQNGEFWPVIQVRPDERLNFPMARRLLATLMARSDDHLDMQ
jgi:hypothetical protein